MMKSLICSYYSIVSIIALNLLILNTIVLIIYPLKLPIFVSSIRNNWEQEPISDIYELTDLNKECDKENLFNYN